MQAKAKTLSFTLLTMVVFTATLELLSSQLIESPEPLFFKKQKTSLPPVGETGDLYTTYDPLLDWTVNSSEVELPTGWKFEEGGYAVTAIRPQLEKRIKILILGGSTSDIFFNHDNCPIQLAQIFEEKTNQGIDIYV